MIKRDNEKTKEKMKGISLTLKPSLLKIIDEERGLIKRSTFMNLLLRKGLRLLMEEREIKENAYLESLKQKYDGVAVHGL